MALMSSTPNATYGRAIQAILMLLFATALGALNVNILGQSIALTFMPLIVICLWPRNAHPIVSIVAILLLGLFLDYLTLEPLGLRSLIYLTVYAVFRPDLRSKAHRFWSAFAKWLGAAIIALILAFFLGWFARETKPDIWQLVLQVILASACFPPVYLLTSVLRALLTDPDDRL